MDEYVESRYEKLYNSNAKTADLPINVMSVWPFYLTEFSSALSRYALHTFLPNTLVQIDPL